VDTQNIYAYSSQDRYQDRIANGKVPLVKIGQTSKSPEDRIRQQDSTSDAYPLEKLWHEQSPFSDHEFHKYLEKNGIKRIRSDREWFEATIEEIKHAFDMLKRGYSRYDEEHERIEAISYPHQDDAVEFLREQYADLNSPNALLAHKPRSGKTYTILRFLSDEKGVLKGEIVLVITHYPVVINQWKETIDKFIDFKDIDGPIFNVTNISEDDYTYSPEKINIVLCSAQDLKGNSEKKGIEKEKFGWLQDQAVNILVIDEVHVGHETELEFNNIVKELNPNFMVGCTATPWKNLVFGSFDLERTHFWTLSEEQAQKDKDPEGVYARYPDMRHLIFEVPDKCLAGYGTEENFTYAKFFEIGEDGKFVYEQDVRTMIRWILGDGKGRKNSIFYKFKPSNILLFVPPGDKIQDNLRSMFQEEFENKGQAWDVHMTNSRINSASKLYELTRNEYRQQPGRDGVLVIAIKQLTTGIDLPDCDMVIQMNDNKSLDYYIQSGYRCQTPGENKKECYHIDLLPYRGLSAVDDYLYHQMIRENKSREEALLDYYDCVDLTVVMRDGKWRSISDLKLWDSILGHFDAFGAQLRRLTRGLTSDCLSEEFLDRIERYGKVFSATSKAVKEALGDEKHKGGKTKKEPKTSGSSLKERDHQAVEFLKNLCKYVWPSYTLYTSFAYDDWDSLVQNMPSWAKEEVEKYANSLITNEEERDLSFDDVTHIFENEIDIKQLNSVLRAWNKRCKQEGSYHVMSIYNNDLDRKNFGAVFTPKELVEIMLKKLPTSLWSNPEMKWIDPACGCGNFLVKVYEKLMDGLSVWQPDEHLRQKHILENMIYGIELQHKHWYACKLFLDPTSRFKLNIVLGDSLEYEWDTKFSIVIGNPPYQEASTSDKHSHKQRGQKNLWTDFVDDALNRLLEPSGYLAFITPNNWLRSTNYLKKVFREKNLIYANIASKEIGRNYFKGVGSSFSWYLVQNCEKQQEPIFDVKGGRLSYDVLAREISPLRNEEKIAYDIFDKLLSAEDTHKRLWIRRNGKGVKYRNEQDSTHCHEALYSATKKKWGSQKTSSAGMHKIVLYRSSSKPPFYDLERSTTDNVYYTTFDSKEESLKFLDIMNSSLYKYIVKNIKSGMAIVSSINSVPYPNDFKQGLYEFFNFTAEEIEHIEKNS